MRIKSIKKPLIAAALIGCAAALFFSSCISYLVRAGRGQFEILWHRRPIAEILADPATPLTVRDRLRHIEIVRNFARDRIGLKTKEIFTTYTHIDRDAVAYNVTAAEELRLKAKTWWFPIVGSVPYLGFFSRAEAEGKAEELVQAGYDTRVQDVPAYSTLGWFNDPVLSSQMRYSDFYLTGLVVHEATHATIWFPGDVTFNESLASFVEEEGALQYVRERYGVASTEFRRAAANLAENELAGSIFKAYAGRLRSVYESVQGPEEKRAAKQALIAAMRAEFRARAGEFTVLDLSRIEKTPYNNAYFLAYLRYESGGAFFAKKYAECEKNWACFFRKMEELKKFSEEERAALLRE